MKIKKLIIQSLSTLLISLSISCDIDGVTDGFDIEINNDILKQKAIIEIFDPNNQKNLEGNNVLTLEVLGEDADKLVTDSGEDISNLKIVDGAVSLAVNPNKDTNNEAVNFTLKISGDDYLTTTIPIQLFESDSTAYFSSNIINKLDTPSGVDYLKENISLSNNTINTTTTITSQTLKGNTYSKVTIEPETIFQDQDGNNISGTDLEIEITNFSSLEDNSLDSFPGGFMPLQITNENGEIQEDASFETLGFVSIDMKIGDTEVKNFSQPITITTQIQSDYINPDTGETIKVGDEVPLWSYSKDDGTWDFHAIGTISLDLNGNKILSYTTTHLSWYNLDFKGSRCSSYRGGVGKINITMNGVSSSNSYNLFSDFLFENTNQPVSNWSGKNKNWYDGQVFELNNTPSNRKIQMVIYSGKSKSSKGEILYKSEPFYGCNANLNLDISSIVGLLPKLTNVSINYKGTCSGKIIAPTIPLWIYDNESSNWRYLGYIYNGSITIKQISLNTNYEFRTMYNGIYYYENLSFDSTNYDNNNYAIPQDLCDRL